MALDSMQEIFEKAAAEQIPFWKVVLETDVEQRQVTEEQSMEKMATVCLGLNHCTSTIHSVWMVSQW